MNKNGIDDLLKIVSPELVAGYEAKNLDGKTLSVVNEEYRAVDRDTWREFFDQVKLVLFSLFVGVILFFYLLIFADTPSHIALTAMVVISAPASFYFFFPARWKFEKDNEVRFRCEPILRGFREAVEAINPDDESDVQISEGGVRFVLANLVDRKYDAEIRYKRACLRGVSAQEIIPVASSLIKCEEQFVAALVGARMLGLTVDTADLFSRAEKRLKKAI